MNIRLLILAAGLTLYISCNTASQSSPDPEPKEKMATAVIFHESHEPKKQSAPFSDIVQVDNLFFLSGQIGMDHGVRELVAGGVEAETKQTLENISFISVFCVTTDFF